MNSKMEKKKKSNINWEILPELIQLIFSKLPFFNLPICRLVCKAWNNLVLTCKFYPPISTSNLFFVHNSPYDRNLHCLELDPKHLDGMGSVAKFSLHPKLFSADHISIVSFCNGLLCCSFEHVGRQCEVCILNLMTNDYFKIPISNADRCKSLSHGFGLSSKTKEYKLARLSLACDKLAIFVDIFTFGTNCKWTPVGFLPPFLTIEKHGVYFNGSLYWVGTDHKRPPYTNVMYRLDIQDEKLQKIYIPQHHADFCFIGVFNGTLYLTLCILDWLDYHVWKMEEDFSWTKAFDVFIPKQYLHLPFHFQLQLIRACEDGKILCLLGGLYLILYDPKIERMKLLPRQLVEFKKVHQIDSFNFDSLHKILAGDAR